MLNLFPRRSGPVALTVTALAALVIGCGGGGGGGGGGNGNATNATTAGTPFTATNGSVPDTTAGSAAGNLPADRIFYVENTFSSTRNISYVPDTANASPTVYAADVPNDTPPVSPDPSVAGRFVFAAKPSGSSTYGIYRNTSVSTVGATVLVNPATNPLYSVYSIEVARDGSRVVYVATTTPDTGTSFADANLFSVSTTPGSTPTTLDADAVFNASLSTDGTRVVYSKYPPGQSDTEIFLYRFDTAAKIALTNNSLFDEEPQFSKDGSLVIFAQEVADSDAYRIGYVNLATGGAPSFVNPYAGSIQRAPSLNSDGNRISFVADEGSGSTPGFVPGVYTADFPSGANPRLVVSSTNLFRATYWSTEGGRSPQGLPFSLSLPRRR